MKCSAAMPCEFLPVDHGLCRTHLRQLTAPAPRLFVVPTPSRIEAPKPIVPSDVQTALVVGVQKFIHSIARKHLSRSTVGNALTYDDLISAGTEGALIAARKFDPGRGFKFLTYAHHWIEHCIRREIENHSRTIRVPINQQKRAWAGDASDGVILRLSRGGGVKSLDAPLLVGDGDLSLHDKTADDRAPTDEAMISEESHEQIRRLVRTIRDPRHRLVIEQRFFHDATLDDVGERLGLSRERVRQLEEEALDNLYLRLSHNGDNK